MNTFHNHVCETKFSRKVSSFKGALCIGALFVSTCYLVLAWNCHEVCRLVWKFVQGICNDSFIFYLKKWALSKMCSIVTCKHAFTCPFACFLIIFSKTKLVASSPRNYWQTLILIFTINLQAQWTQLQSWSQMLISQNPWSKAVKSNECPLCLYLSFLLLLHGALLLSLVLKSTIYENGTFIKH